MRFVVLVALALGLVPTAAQAGTNAWPMPISCSDWSGDTAVVGRPPNTVDGDTPSQAAHEARRTDAGYLQGRVSKAMQRDHLGWGAPTLTQTMLFADAFCALYPGARDLTTYVVQAAEDVGRRRLATGR